MLLANRFRILPLRFYNLTDSADTVITLLGSGPTVLACGAWLKNTLCLTQQDKAYVSPLIGDLDSLDARERFEQTVNRLCTTFPLPVEIVVHDLHPDFYSSQFAQAYAEHHEIPVLAVQHHHAHIAAICAEHHLNQPVLGLALDGVGLGTDNTLWGGELLRVDGAQVQRIGHLAPLALPGGDRAAREPWRMAAAVLAKLGRGSEITQRFTKQSAAATVATMLDNNLNCPQTSSMGRLFDAAAGLLDIYPVQMHEAQAAVQLQKLAEEHGPIKGLAQGYQITADNILDFTPLLVSLLDWADAKRSISEAAALFHATLIDGLTGWINEAAYRYNIAHLALGGGCFHNRLLCNGLLQRLTTPVFQVHGALQMRPDDSAIALGQAWVALQLGSSQTHRPRE